MSASLHFRRIEPNPKRLPADLPSEVIATIEDIFGSLPHTFTTQDMDTLAAMGRVAKEPFWAALAAAVKAHETVEVFAQY